MLIHPKNVGRSIKLRDGRVEKIAQVLANRQAFRVSSEALGPIVHDYSFSDVLESKGLILSFDDGASWTNTSVSPV